MTGSYGLNDNRLYLRTNGDTNHFLWNAADDWEELIFYSGTGFRIAGSNGGNYAQITTSGINATNMTIGGAQVWYNSGGWMADFASYGFTRHWGINVSGGEFVTLYASGQVSTLIDGSYFAGENNGFFSLNGSNQYTSRVGFSNSGGGVANFNAPIRINTNNNIYLDYNYGQSIVGVYTSTRYQGVFAMGDSYKLAIDGSSPGSLYGLAWSHPNAGGQAALGLNDHGLLVMNYGTTFAAISSRIWARDQMNAPIYYDRNTAFYLDGDSNSRLSHGRFVGSSGYYSLLLGPDTLATNGSTSVYPDGDRYGLVVNAPYYPHVYINSYADNGNTTHGGVLSFIGNLTSGGYRKFVMGIANRNPNEMSFGWFDNNYNPHYGVGINWSYPASVWYDTGNNWYARGSMRSPIFYDSNDTTYYGDFNGQSRISSINMGYQGGQVYTAAGQGILFFNSHGEGDIQGYSIGTTLENYNGNYTKLTLDWHTGIKIGAAFNYGGIRFYNNSVKYYGGSQLFSIGEGDQHVRVNNVLFVSGDARAPIFYDQNDTSWYVDPNSNSNLQFIECRRYGFRYPGGDSGVGAEAYNLFQEGGGWGYPYPDLRIAYHTGIKLGANSSYEGTRIYDDYPMGTIRWQFNGGSGYNYQYTWTQLTGHHGHYSPINNAHWYPNDVTYGAWRMQGNRNGWYGHRIESSYAPHLMFESGNGGIYYQDIGRWVMYHSLGNNCTGMGTSSTAGGYAIYCNGGVYATGNIVAYSDIRKKKDIVTVDNALDKVLQLRGIYYTKIYNETDTIPDGGADKRQLGVIAQEVNEVVPEVVSYTEDLDEYAVAYGNFAGLFIEAFKEQNEIIKKQADEIQEMKEILNKLIFNNKG
jgi:hypothetical protein